MKQLSMILLIYLCSAGLFAQKKSNAHRMLNPICPAGVYIADPEARQMPDGRIYLYGSHDEPENQWCSHSYDILSSSDMVRWDIEQKSFATKGLGKQTDYTDKLLYAPDCIYHNGLYYLYYCIAGDNNDEVNGVATSTSPYGPFVNGQLIKGAKGIDPSVFIDDDGQAYLYWAQFASKGAKLSKDMLSIEGEVKDLLSFKETRFHEGSSVRKRNGIYYYVYASSERHKRGASTLSYCTSTSPLGPFTYRGVIIDNADNSRLIGNNHGCIAEINNKWYVFYHRNTHGRNTMRKACVEPISFNKDGTINEVQMTTQGIGGPIDPLVRMEAARSCKVSGNLIVKERRLHSDIILEYLSEIRNNDIAYWKYFDFTHKNVNHFSCKTWGQNLSGKIEIRLDKPDGELIGICDIPTLKDSVAYSIHATDIKKISGIHALVLTFKATNPEENEKNLFDLEWFSFESIKKTN